LECTTKRAVCQYIVFIICLTVFIRINSNNKANEVCSGFYETLDSGKKNVKQMKTNSYKTPWNTDSVAPASHIPAADNQLQFHFAHPGKTQTASDDWVPYLCWTAYASKRFRIIF
jgi:hypothetical protein